jgi:hypothetical protein
LLTVPFSVATDRVHLVRRRMVARAWRNSAPESAQTSRRHHLSPAETHGAVAGKRREPFRPGVRAHTHAPCALKVQRKLSNGVAGFAAGGSSSDRKRSRPIRAFSARPHDGQRPCRSRQNPAPSCLIPGAAAQTRVVSVAKIRLDRLKSMQSFKGIICDDISEFESHMPSHAVRSPWASGPATNTGPLHTLGRKKAPRGSGARG